MPKDLIDAFNRDAARVAERNKVNRERMSGESGATVRRQALAVRRGVEVPPELEARWNELRKLGLSAPETAKTLGLTLDPRLVAKANRSRRKSARKRKKKDAAK